MAALSEAERGECVLMERGTSTRAQGSLHQVNDNENSERTCRVQGGSWRQVREHKQSNDENMVQHDIHTANVSPIWL